jgi:Uma2 family endonuclease
MNDINRYVSVAQYHEMINSGELGEDDPIELLHGRLVVKMTKNPAHCSSNWRTRAALERLVPAGWYVTSQDPITLEDSEPEPDLTVAEGDPDRYFDRHPGAADVGLLVEVADTTLQRDQTVKRAIYAEARIPVYWIVNLVDRQVEVCTQPSGPCEHPDYGQCDIYRLGDEIPVVIRGQEVGRITAAELLPKTRTL